MNDQIKSKLFEVLNNCKKEKYPNICKKCRYEDGKETVANMLYNRLKKFPDWEIDNAMADVEFNLNDIEHD
jgi:hypothetical protein